MGDDPRKLSEEDLLIYLKSILNSPVRLSDLKTPTREFVSSLFELCLHDLHIDIHNPILRSFDAIRHFENPELFQDAQVLLLLVTGINFVTNFTSFDIYIGDVTEPKPKKTKKILNYLVVFWSNALKKQSHFESIEKSFLEERKQAEELLDKQQILENKFIELSSILENLKPVEEELKSCISSKYEKINELDAQKQHINEEYSGLKQKENDLQAQITATNIELASAGEKITELDQLILTSPERLSTDLQKLKECIKNEDIRIREKEMELKEKKKKQDALMNSQEENMKTLEIVQGLQNGVQDWSNVVKSILVDNQKYQEEEEQVKRMMSELEMRDKFKTIHVDKEAKILLNTRKQKESIKDTLEMLQKNVVEQKKNLKIIKDKESQISQKTDEEADAIIEVVNKCKEAEAITENAYAEYAKVMEAMCSSFLSDCEELKSQAKRVFKH